MLSVAARIAAHLQIVAANPLQHTLHVAARIAAHLQPAACLACAFTAKASAKRNATRTCCRTSELLMSPERLHRILVEAAHTGQSPTQSTHCVYDKESKH
ncbi:hypothetical protein V8C86DRAFT_2894377, partial [Haematococcus lacustris]